MEARGLEVAARVDHEAPVREPRRVLDGAGGGLVAAGVEVEGHELAEGLQAPERAPDRRGLERRGGRTDRQRVALVVAELRRALGDVGDVHGERRERGAVRRRAVREDEARVALEGRLEQRRRAVQFEEGRAAGLDFHAGAGEADGLGRGPDGRGGCQEREEAEHDLLVCSEGSTRRRSQHDDAREGLASETRAPVV